MIQLRGLTKYQSARVISRLREWVVGGYAVTSYEEGFHVAPSDMWIVNETGKNSGEIPYSICFLVNEEDMGDCIYPREMKIRIYQNGRCGKLLAEYEGTELFPLLGLRGLFCPCKWDSITDEAVMEWARKDGII